MTSKPSFWLSPKGLAAIGLIGAASYFLLMEHRQHVFEYLPFLILLACPLMHVFMHGGHGGHGGHGSHESHEQGKAKAKVKESVDMDDYRRGYEDAQKDAREHKHNEDDHHAR